MQNKQLDQRKCKKYEDIVMMLIGTYRKDKFAFMLGTKYVRFTRNDVILIFGISCGK